MVNGLTALTSSLDESRELLELASEDDDQDTVTAVEEDLAAVEERVASLEFRRMFAGEMDAASAF